MKSYLKTGMVEKQTVVDSNTGEIIESNIKHHKYIANTKEEFMLIYVTVLPTFMNLSNSAKGVYAYLLYTYDAKAIFEIGGGTRALMSKRLNHALSTIANAITELKEASLIYSHGKGMYQINPRYAFKGSTSERNDALKAIIELGCKEC